MNAVRSVISIFLILLIGVSIAGWVWSGDLPAKGMMGARLVLAVCGLSAIGGLSLIWSARRPSQYTS
jgi:hypothetical protein